MNNQQASQPVQPAEVVDDDDQQPQALVEYYSKPKFLGRNSREWVWQHVLELGPGHDRHDANGKCKAGATVRPPVMGGRCAAMGTPL